jgi:Polyketide cyclase / dehydrase and lipid transport
MRRTSGALQRTDRGRTKKWYQNITSVSWQTPRPAVEGSPVTFEARFLGRRLRYTYEIRELVPEERLVMSTSEGAFPMETTYTWADTPEGGTRMTLRNRGEPSGFASIATPAMAAAMRRANRKDLRPSKAVLERQRS